MKYLPAWIFIGIVFQSAAVWAQPAKHVIIISIDGLHQADLDDPVLRDHMPAILSLIRGGVSYSNAATTFPSDSVPGELAYLTGAGPATTGVYFDDTYCRSFLQAGSAHDGKAGAAMHVGEDIDKDPTLLNGGGDGGVSAIDAAKLPLDPARNFSPVYPHDYLKVNTIFEIAHAAGMRTAVLDKHAAYEIDAGPSGKGLDDLYGPESHAHAAMVDGKLVDASDAPADTKLKHSNKSTGLMIAADNLRLAALLNEIHGKGLHGDQPAAVPGIIAMNFQALSVAQRDPEGGIDVAEGKETPSTKYLKALTNADDGIATLVKELKAAGLWDQTLLVLTAKHGQSPRVGLARVISESSILDPLKKANIGVASTTVDDVELIWLSDSSQTQAAAKALESLAAGNDNPGIERVLWGESAKAANLVGPPDRTPDLFVLLKPAVLISEDVTRAKHGGHCEDDFHVPVILGGGAIDRSRQGVVIADKVKTTQIAVTVLTALGLDPAALQGAKAEQTAALPGSGL